MKQKIHLAVTALAVAAAFGFSASAMGTVYNNTQTREQLNNKLIDIQQDCNNLIAVADAEKREMTEEEQLQFERLTRDFEACEADIERRERMDNMTAKTNETLGRQTNAVVTPANAADEPNAEQTRIVRPNAAERSRYGNKSVPAQPVNNERGSWGFRTVGEYLNAVRKAASQGAQPDPRLIANAPTTYGSEGVGADGGFAVPPDFRSAIISKVLGEQSLLGMTDSMTSSSNSMTVPVDETAPWDNEQAGGIQAYWEAEAGLKRQSKPKLTEVSVKLNKLISLVPLTDELLEDAPAMGGYVTSKAPDKINFKVNDAIINGTGVGMPLGILNSPGTVIVPGNAGQTVDTINYDNVVNMYTRMYAPARSRAVWLVNGDVEGQLMRMSFPGTGTAVPAYLPPGGLSASPYGTLMGRPVINTEAMPGLGDQGDIIFADMSSYLTITKGSGIRQDISIHIYFDYDVTAFRFVLRVGGQPWYNSPVQRPNGQTSRGFFVALGPR